MATISQVNTLLAELEKSALVYKNIDNLHKKLQKLTLKYGIERKLEKPAESDSPHDWVIHNTKLNQKSQFCLLVPAKTFYFLTNKGLVDKTKMILDTNKNTHNNICFKIDKRVFSCKYKFAKNFNFDATELELNNVCNDKTVPIEIRNYLIKVNENIISSANFKNAIPLGILFYCTKFLNLLYQREIKATKILKKISYINSKELVPDPKIIELYASYDKAKDGIAEITNHPPQIPKSDSNNNIDNLFEKFHKKYTSLDSNINYLNTIILKISNKEKPIFENLESRIIKLNKQSEALSNPNLNQDSATIKKMQNNIQTSYDEINAVLPYFDKLNNIPSNTILPILYNFKKNSEKEINLNKNSLSSPQNVQKIFEQIKNSSEKLVPLLIDSLYANIQQPSIKYPDLTREIKESINPIREQIEQYNKAISAINNNTDNNNSISDEDIASISMESEKALKSSFETNDEYKSLDNNNINKFTKANNPNILFETVQSHAQEITKKLYPQEQPPYSIYYTASFLIVSCHTITKYTNIIKQLYNALNPHLAYLSELSKQIRDSANAANKSEDSKPKSTASKIDSTISILSCLGCFTGVALSLASPILAGVVFAVSFGATIYNIAKIWSNNQLSITNLFKHNQIIDS